MRIEDRVEDVDARLKRVAAEVQGLMQMRTRIYGAEYGRSVPRSRDTTSDRTTSGPRSNRHASKMIVKTGLTTLRS